MAITDTLLFLREWIKHPPNVATCAPSGRALASLITSGITPRTGPVLELGPGTGVFTQALLARGVPEKDLTLVELGSSFVRLLQSRFPRARVLWLDVTKLRSEMTLQADSFGAAVSGLGFLNMKEEQIKKVLQSVFSYLRPNGSFYFFTYGSKSSVPEPVLTSLGLRVTRVGKTYLNIPPAIVYQITRVNEGLKTTAFDRASARGRIVPLESVASKVGTERN